MYLSIIGVASGGALGSLLRWVISLKLNPISPFIFIGTWLVNLLAGFAIGLAIGYFSRHVNLSIEWQYFFITGFLGGLSTFSTFSAEVTTRLQQGQLGLAITEIALHVIGSIGMTALGLWLSSRA